MDNQSRPANHHADANGWINVSMFPPEEGDCVDGDIWLWMPHHKVPQIATFASVGKATHWHPWPGNVILRKPPETVANAVAVEAEVEAIRRIGKLLENYEGRRIDDLDGEAHRKVAAAKEAWNAAWGPLRIFPHPDDVSRGTVLCLDGLRAARDLKYKKLRLMMEEEMAVSGDDYPPRKPVLNLDQDRTTLEIRPPFVDPETPVTVGIDYYGASPRLQLLCYGTQIDESQVDVQYDAAGNVAAVEVNDPSVTLRLWDSRRGDVDIRTDGNRVEVVTSREVVHVVRAAPEMPAWRVARDRQQGM